MSEVDVIFDAVGKAFDIIHKQDEINKAKKRLVETEKKQCGMCRLWMTSYCKPEKEHRQFKSMSSYPCKDFEREYIYEDMIVERKAKLKALEEK